jgi:hypothetical protein
MLQRKAILKTPREHFMQVVNDELAKFVSGEIAFQKVDRADRARELRLPLFGENLGARRALNTNTKRCKR